MGVVFGIEKSISHFQAAKYIKHELDPFAELIEDVQGYKYLDNRDLIDFVEAKTGNLYFMPSVSLFEELMKD